MSGATDAASGDAEDAMDWMSVCKACPFRERWDTKDAVLVASVWHVYEEHPEQYAVLVGATEPGDMMGRPEEYGRKLDP